MSQKRVTTEPDQAQCLLSINDKEDLLFLMPFDFQFSALPICLDSFHIQHHQKQNLFD